MQHNKQNFLIALRLHFFKALSVHTVDFQSVRECVSLLLSRGYSSDNIFMHSPTQEDRLVLVVEPCGFVSSAKNVICIGQPESNCLSSDNEITCLFNWQRKTQPSKTRTNQKRTKSPTTEDSL